LTVLNETYSSPAISGPVRRGPASGQQAEDLGVQGGAGGAAPGLAFQQVVAQG
jgi:hypothetical protein